MSSTVVYKGTKKCLGPCGKTLSVVFFHVDRQKPDGRVDQCKSCKKTYGYVRVQVKRTCAICGGTFLGPKKAKYCPAPKECRQVAAKNKWKRCMQKKYNQGLTARGTVRVAPNKSKIVKARKVQSGG